jgi:hypothetical protein
LSGVRAGHQGIGRLQFVVREGRNQSVRPAIMRNGRWPSGVCPGIAVMNRISAKIKELVAEVIGDGNMFDEARQEEATAGKPVLESKKKDLVQDGALAEGELDTPTHAEPESERQGASPPPNLHPMKDFDPGEPAILHDAVKDCIVTWDWERADDFKKNAVYDSEGRVAWHGHVFDGWGNVLGG